MNLGHWEVGKHWGGLRLTIQTPLTAEDYLGSVEP